MKIVIDYLTSIFLINGSLTKESFIEKAGVINGYALDVFSRIYDNVFSELVDLEIEFAKYYSFEYENIETFFYKKYNLDLEIISKLMEKKKLNPHCTIYRRDENSYGDFGLVQFMYSDVMYERIMNLLISKSDNK